MPLHIGTLKNGKALNLKTESLTDHGFAAGMTGSGKTGLLMTLAEESLKCEKNVILVDIKGDLGNLADRVADLGDNVEFRFVSPGAYHGEAVNLLSGLSDADRITPTVTALLKLIEVDSDPIRSVEHAFLSVLLKTYHDEKKIPSLVDLIQGIIDPPFETLGAMKVATVLPTNTRLKLAGSINTVLVAPSFDPWKYGISLDVDALLTPEVEGNSVCVIYSVAHLVEDDERLFALSALFDALVSYMRTREGSNDLETLVIVDEVYGLLPAYPANPPTKRPLMVLLKQARAVGIGLILATQNPVDVDYKALSNCGTWYVGRLQTVKDRKRVIEAVCSTGMYSASQLDAMIGGLDKRCFMVCRTNAVHEFSTRDVGCAMNGPLSPSQIRDLYAQGAFRAPDVINLLRQKLAEAQAMADKEPNCAVFVNKVAQLELMIAELESSDDLESSDIPDSDIIEATIEAPAF